MIKAGDIYKVEAVFLDTPMVSDEVPKTEKKYLDEYEYAWVFEPEV